MLEQLVVVHDKSHQHPLPEGPTWVQWKTCIRQLAIGFPEKRTESFSEGLESYQGIDAYNFLLEVICGLHSPLVGETEIMGQYKELIEGENIKTSHMPLQFLKLFKDLLTDAKYVRQVHLKDLGSRSYGSLIRKYLKETNLATLVGSGKLAEDILPWMKSGPSVNLRYRNERRAHDLKTKFPFVEISKNSPLGDTVIVAAPLSNDELISIVGNLDKVKCIIDLRESSTRKPLKVNVEVITLKKVFSEVKSVEREAQVKVNKAKELIGELSQKWFHSAELRPFGWEDLCG